MARRDLTYKNLNRLSIIDPNDRGNDISGGSSNIQTVFGAFAEAYALIRDRMDAMGQYHQVPAGVSLLDVIFAGNYSTYLCQRDHMRKLANPHSAAAAPPAQPW